MGPVGMPERYDDDGESIHMRQIEKIVSIVTEAPGRYQNSGHMECSSIKPYNAELDNIESFWGILATSSHLLLHQAVRYLCNELENGVYTADFPQVPESSRLNATLPYISKFKMAFNSCLRWPTSHL